MHHLSAIALLIFLIAIGIVLGGCERGPGNLTSPSGDSPADKRACPAVTLTYADPETIDEPWSGGIKDFCVVAAHGGYHLLHITDPGTGWTSRDGELTFGHAFSLDLVTWATQPRIDLRTDPASWSPSFTWAPHVIFNEADGLYYMFYTGVSWRHGEPFHAAQQRVGLARSPDLFTWTRYSENDMDGLILDGPDHEEHPWSAFGTDGVDLPWEYDCRDPFVFDRGPDHGEMRYVMLNTVRLAPDAQYVAIAYATSGDLLSWTWQHYFPITVGEKAESANLLEHEGNFYLFWTVRDEVPAVQVACSTSGIFGDYSLVNGGGWLFGSANETLAEADRTLYFAFDDMFNLHVKRDLLLPETPTTSARVRVVDFTLCDPTRPLGRRDP